MTSNHGHSDGEPSTNSQTLGGLLLPSVCALTAIALTLRCFGLDFGLPLLSNPYVRPDESLLVVAAVRMLEGAADPHFSVYPAFFTSLCALAFAVHHGVGLALGLLTAPTVALDFGLHPSSYFLLARGWSALCGALTVPVVFLLGQRLGGRAAGFFAAALLTVAPLAVRDAHFGVTDTATALLVATALLCLLSVPATPGRLLPRALVAGSAWLGLAIGCKYSALGMLPVLAVACILSPLRALSRLGRLLICLGIATLAFILCNPYVLVRPLEYYSAVRGTAGFIYAAPGAAGDLGRALGQLLHPLRYGPGGYVGLLLAGVGALWCLRRGGGATHRLLLLAALLALAPAYSPRETIFFRYVVLALPLLAVLAGLGGAWLGRLVTPHLRRPVWGLLLATCLLPTALLSVRLDRLLATPDTRTVAGAWVRQNVTPQTPVVLLAGPESEPQLPETRASLLRRRAHVIERYGPGSAAIINQLYDLQISARAACPNEGYELLRELPSGAFAAQPFVLIQSAYPATTPPPLPPVVAAAVTSGAITVSPAFEALGLTGRGPYDRDHLDAFFLPFTGLDQVRRPGPNLFVYRVTPASSGGRP